jgi:hypothetical protein
LLLERPRPAWRRELRGLAAELDESELRQLAGTAAGSSEGGYLAVFGPGGAVSPREVSYRGMADPGRLLSALAAIYEAFAYRPHVGEPADHAAVETGFLSYLHLKEAYALARGDEADLVVTRAALRRFTDEHLAGFLDRLASRLEVARAEGLRRAARCAAECAGLRPAALRVIEPAGGQEPPGGFTCGSC